MSQSVTEALTPQVRRATIVASPAERAEPRSWLSHSALVAMEILTRNVSVSFLFSAIFMLSYEFISSFSVSDYSEPKK